MDKDYGRSVDIWSLGCILYYYINHVHLFSRPREMFEWPGLKESIADPILRKSWKQGYLNLESRYPIFYSEHLLDVAHKMLKMNPTERPKAGEINAEAKLREDPRLANMNIST